MIDARAQIVVSKESREWGSTAEAQKICRLKPSS